MLIVLFIVCIALIGLGVVIYNKTDSEFGTAGTAVAFLGGIVGVIAVGTLLICTGIEVSKGMIIDDKINLYETENSKIDKQVYSIVESYKGYEKDTFKSIKNKNADTLVSLYPELKSDTLVKEQIKIYNSNRKQIIKLKQEKLEQKPLRWWLYFGG